MAALVARLGGAAVYDADLDVTWISDINLASTNTFGVSNVDVDGGMSWETANNWVAAMNNFEGAGYLGFNDWRLPIWRTFTGNVNMDGEMGHLYYKELGGTQLGGIDFEDPDASLFTEDFNFGVHNLFWTDTLVDPVNTGGMDCCAHVFDFNNGSTYVHNKETLFRHTFVVRTGDVSEVPVPASAWFLASGLIGLVFSRNRKN